MASQSVVTGHDGEGQVPVHVQRVVAEDDQDAPESLSSPVHRRPKDDESASPNSLQKAQPEAEVEIEADAEAEEKEVAEAHVAIQGSAAQGPSVLSKDEDAAMSALKAKLSQIDGALKLAVSEESKLFAAAHTDAEIASTFAALKQSMDAREKALRTELDDSAQRQTAVLKAKREKLEEYADAVTAAMSEQNALILDAQIDSAKRESKIKEIAAEVTQSIDDENIRVIVAPALFCADREAIEKYISMIGRVSVAPNAPRLTVSDVLSTSAVVSLHSELTVHELAAKLKRQKHDREAELKRQKLRVIAQNNYKQRLASKTEQNLNRRWRAKVRCAVKKEVNPLTSEMLQDAKPVFSGKSSIYALDEVSKEWVDRGISGQLIMFQNQQFRTDIRIKWSSKNQRKIWWRLMNGKLEPKGERAWVVKAWDTQTNKQEILAIRFSDVQLSQQFSVKFHQIFPAQPPPVPKTGSGVNSLGV